MPIATGENEYTLLRLPRPDRPRCRRHFQRRRPNLGGLTEFMQVAALAASQDLLIASHGAGGHIHAVCAISNGLILEYYRETVDPLRMQIFLEPMKLDSEGYVAAPDRPGWGSRRIMSCWSGIGLADEGMTR
ncbi:MAG: enolase C-terminal domain-like protein [Caldilineaceae bacterium]